MFTGLVQAVGDVRGALRKGKTLRLEVHTGRWAYARKARVGDSVSVAGVCLTIVRITGTSGRTLAFDVVQETLDKTSLGSLRPGDRVNLEHAATASTLLGGHIVQGHVDGVGRVSRVQRGGDWRVWIDLPKPLRAFVVGKGSIAIDGVSLTVAGVTKSGLWVALIPQTLKDTTLSRLDEGHAVNVETDVIAKMVARAQEASKKRPTLKKPPGTRARRSRR